MSVIILKLIILNVIVQSVIKPNVITVSVVAPSGELSPNPEPDGPQKVLLMS
jgi:hypothetical protein